MTGNPSGTATATSAMGRGKEAVCKAPAGRTEITYEALVKWARGPKDSNPMVIRTDPMYMWPVYGVKVTCHTLGGPLSPLLSNILLDDLDKELERRGHQFCRYADDANIYVRTKRAGERVMQSVTDFMTTRLKLRVNQDKSAVDRPWKRQFLGYSMTAARDPKLRVSPDREKRFKKKLRPLLRAGRGRSVADSLSRLAPKIRGWVGYFKRCDVKAAFERLDAWLRRRIRVVFWRQWKRYRTRLKEMIKRGLQYARAKLSAGNGRGPWWNSGASHVNQAVPTRELRRLGYISVLEEFQRLKCSTG